MQILLYGGSALTFSNNTALQEGGALYVKTTTSDSLFPVKNKNCFIQFYSNNDDIPPSQWVREFVMHDDIISRLMGELVMHDDIISRLMGEFVMHDDIISRLMGEFVMHDDITISSV